MNTSFENATKDDHKDEWLTPPYILHALGEFDLDPCAPVKRPWNIAKEHFTEEDSGLLKDWGAGGEARVFCNPPYGNETGHWLNKCAMHKNAVALTFARTETRMFFDCVWRAAYGIFFFRGRIKFYHVDGTMGSSAGAPSVLIAYDEKNSQVLENISIKGKYIKLK